MQYFYRVDYCVGGKCPCGIAIGVSSPAAVLADGRLSSTYIVQQFGDERGFISADGNSAVYPGRRAG